MYIEEEEVRGNRSSIPFQAAQKLISIKPLRPTSIMSDDDGDGAAEGDDPLWTGYYLFGVSRYTVIINSYECL